MTRTLPKPPRSLAIGTAAWNPSTTRRTLGPQATSQTRRRHEAAKIGLSGAQQATLAGSAVSRYLRFSHFPMGGSFIRRAPAHSLSWRAGVCRGKPAVTDSGSVED